MTLNQNLLSHRRMQSQFLISIDSTRIMIKHCLRRFLFVLIWILFNCDNCCTFVLYMFFYMYMFGRLSYDRRKKKHLSLPQYGKPMDPLPQMFTLLERLSGRIHIHGFIFLHFLFHHIINYIFDDSWSMLALQLQKPFN